LEEAGPLRQFRGIGRFTFVFFYALNLFAAVTISHYLKTKSKAAITASLFALLILFSEGAYFSREVNELTQDGSDQFANNVWRDQDFSSFSAILPWH
jgi:hypothetical protein